MFGEVLAPDRGRVGGGHRGVEAFEALAGQRHAACLDLTEAHPQRAVADRAVGLAEPARLGQRAKRRLAQQHIGAVPAGRSLDGVDHRDPALGHPPVQVVDVEDPRGQVVDVGGAHAGDVGGHRGHGGQLGVPGAVHRFATTGRTTRPRGRRSPRRGPRRSRRRPRSGGRRRSARARTTARRRGIARRGRAGRCRRSGCRGWPASR